MTMVLEVENKPSEYVTDFARVERALRALRSYGPQSFASLTKPNGSYMQVAGGRVTCVLELCDRSRQNHRRAHLAVPRVPFEGPQTLAFGGGSVTMMPDEILFIDDVIVAFLAFFEGSSLPGEICWRDMSSIT